MEETETVLLRACSDLTGRHLCHRGGGDIPQNAPFIRASKCQFGLKPLLWCAVAADKPLCFSAFPWDICPVFAAPTPLLRREARQEVNAVHPASTRPQQDTRHRDTSLSAWISEDMVLKTVTRTGLELSYCIPWVSEELFLLVIWRSTHLCQGTQVVTVL